MALIVLMGTEHQWQFQSDLKIPDFLGGRRVKIAVQIWFLQRVQVVKSCKAMAIGDKPEHGGGTQTSLLLLLLFLKKISETTETETRANFISGRRGRSKHLQVEYSGISNF